MYIFVVIAIAVLYVGSMTINFRKVPKYKYSFFIPLYLLTWFDLLFSIAASMNLPIVLNKKRTKIRDRMSSLTLL